MTVVFLVMNSSSSTLPLSLMPSLSSVYLYTVFSAKCMSVLSTNDEKALRTAVVGLALLDNLVDVYLGQGSLHDDEFVLFFKWQTHIDNNLLVHKSLGHSRFASLAELGWLRHSDLLKAR